MVPIVGGLGPDCNTFASPDVWVPRIDAGSFSWTYVVRDQRGSWATARSLLYPAFLRFPQLFRLFRREGGACNPVADHDSLDGQSVVLALAEAIQLKGPGRGEVGRTTREPWSRSVHDIRFAKVLFRVSG